MFKKPLSLMLVGSLTYAALVAPGLPQSTTGRNNPLAEKVKTQILHLGIGEKSRVKVKLSNNTNVEGYISKAGEDSFEVTDKKTGTATTVAYQNVVRVKGNGLSIGSKIAIGVGIAGVAFAALVLAVVHSLS